MLSELKTCPPSGRRAACVRSPQGGVPSGQSGGGPRVTVDKQAHTWRLIVQNSPCHLPDTVTLCRGTQPCDLEFTVEVCGVIGNTGSEHVLELKRVPRQNCGQKEARLQIQDGL